MQLRSILPHPTNLLHRMQLTSLIRQMNITETILDAPPTEARKNSMKNLLDRETNIEQLMYQRILYLIQDSRTFYAKYVTETYAKILYQSEVSAVRAYSTI